MSGTVGRLFDPDRHEPLADAPWDEAQVRDAIQAIVDDIERCRLPAGQWPVHPRDDEGDSPADGFKGLYLGSAGLWWALWYLQREGAAVLASDPVAGIHQTHAAYLASPDSGEVLPSYYLGESGILLALWRLTGSESAANALHACVESNIANPTLEALWAAPGSMGAAWHLWQATGEARWRELFGRNVDHLWRTWAFDERANCHLWTQDLYGHVVQYLGAGHGFAGNVYPLLKGAALLDDARREALYERCEQTLQATAIVQGGAVNWPIRTFTARPGRPEVLMQWCHGAPGIVTALADFPAGRSAVMDALLSGAGEAVWQAGPLAKGCGLCHGTAGNGYAFLTLYARSGDALWLDRARRFAMHALAQRARVRRQHDPPRCTLWTGDAGLAVFLWHGLRGVAALPALDIV